MSIILSVGFWATITHACPGDDFTPVLLNLRVRYRRLKKTERLDMDRRLSAGVLTAETRKMLQARIDAPDTPEKVRAELRLKLEAKPMDDEEFLNLMILDWDLKGHDGKPIIYTPKERAEQEEKWDGLEEAMAAGYFKALKESVTPEAIAKNSAAQSATSS